MSHCLQVLILFINFKWITLLFSSDSSLKLFGEGRAEHLRTGIVSHQLHTIIQVSQHNYLLQNYGIFQTTEKSLLLQELENSNIILSCTWSNWMTSLSTGANT